MAWRFWQPTQTGNRPSLRSTVASAIYGNELFIAGGWDGKDAHNDAHAFHLDTLHWRKLHLGKGAEQSEKALPGGKRAPPQGLSFGGRMMFGFCSHEHRLFIHGGMMSTNLAVMFDDVIVLDMEKSKLSLLPTTGDGPGKIARQPMAVFQGSIYVSGGWVAKKTNEAQGLWTDGTWRLDLDTNVWTKLEVEGFTPWHRAHGCLVGVPTPTPHLLNFGGGDGDVDFDDVYKFDLATSYWSRLHNATGRSEKRSQGACALLPPSMGQAWGAFGAPHHALGIHGGFGGRKLPGTKYLKDEDMSKRASMLMLPLGGKDPRVRSGGGRGKRKPAEVLRWREMRATADGHPPARMGHVMHVVNDTLMVLFGGNGEDRKHRNDVYFGEPNKGLTVTGEHEDDWLSEEEAQRQREAAEAYELLNPGGGGEGVLLSTRRTADKKALKDAKKKKEKKARAKEKRAALAAGASSPPPLPKEEV